MKRGVFIVFVIICSGCFAQDPFVRITDFKNGITTRIVPDGNNGWAIFSSDSVRISGYSSCGLNAWAKKYAAPAVTQGLFDFIRLSNGDYAFMNMIEKNGVYITAVSRIDASGNILWSKSYGDADYTQYPYTLMEDPNGNLYIYGNFVYHQTNPVYNTLLKLDANGNLLLSDFYNHGYVWGGAIITSDNGILMRTGERFIKTDMNGAVLWSTDLIGGFYHFLKAVEVSDGYIFTGYTNPGNKIIFFKMDKSGNLLWNGGKTLDIEGVPPRISKTPSGNIAGIFIKTWNAVSYTSIIEFDKDLNIVKENSLDNTLSLNGVELCFLNDGTSVMAGYDGTGNTFFAHLDADYKSGCDIQLPPVIITSFPAAMIPAATAVLPTNFTTYTENYAADTFSVGTTMHCAPLKILDLGNDTAVCEGTSVELKNHSADVFDNYIWSDGQTTASITVADSGMYYLAVKDFCGETALYDTVKISVLKSVKADAGPDQVLCEDEHLILHTGACDSCSYSWSNGSISDTADIEKPGIYIVTVSNADGCFDNDTIEVEQSKCECNIYLPKAFTPNHDAINEKFGAAFYCDLMDFQLLIFNRWGQKVFATRNPEETWNGTLNDTDVPSGVYIYNLQYTSIIRGKKDNPVKKTGTVTLIR
jgi:gliding motility-associated-like protein